MEFGGLQKRSMIVENRYSGNGNWGISETDGISIHSLVVKCYRSFLLWRIWNRSGFARQRANSV